MNNEYEEETRNVKLCDEDKQAERTPNSYA